MSSVDRGYIKLFRRLLDNQMWLSEPFTRGQAWIDMLLLANHKAGYIRKRGVKIAVLRGQLGWSELALSKRWHWSRGKVRRFLKELKTEHQIEHQKTNVTTLISIINYDIYQGDNTTDETPNGHQTDTKRYRNKNDKNEKKKHICVKPQENDEDFERFYEAYPKKKAKDVALRAWKKKDNGRPPIDELLVILEKHIRTDDWKKDGGQFIPHPATWLNGKRWEDEIEDPQDDEPPYWSN